MGFKRDKISLNFKIKNFSTKNYIIKVKFKLFHIFLHLKLYYKQAVLTTYPHYVDKFWDK